jgi:peroxiredoxin
VTVIGVPSSDTLEAMRDFVDRHGLEDVPQAVDLEREVWNAFRVPAQPAWAFVTPDGEVTRHLGPLDLDGIEQALTDLLDR